MIKNLSKIQNEMNVKKGRYNKFGGYYYRSCEDILQTAKEVCNKYGCYVNVTDSIEYIEGRFYVKATAKVVDIETGELETATAFAREEESKKGMDGAQLTGATSSYARKYALCGLFAIDDSIDSDSLNGTQESAGKASNKKVPDKSSDQSKQSQSQVSILIGYVNECTTLQQLGELFKANQAYQSNSDFMNALSKKRAEIEKNK
ncbi:ERF family protein [Ruminococcus intestinalis]|uniref:ERF family protein n=1 Tax=Ruminococcus intestinalis TaxID=2763066 RepID=UPI003F7E90CE